MDLPLRQLNGLLMTVLAALAALLLVSPPAQAQGVGAFGQGGAPHIRISLLAETHRPAPGHTVTLALFMRPDPGWHGYWENPGDAGTGMTIDWALPAGVSAGALRYPTPQKLLISGLMNHVYEHDYAILFDVNLPADLKPGARVPVRGTAHWLACTDSLCVPEQGRVETVLTVGDGAIRPDDRARFDAFRAKLPRALDQPARYAIQDGRIAIAVPYPAAAPVGAPWFFALTRDRLRYAGPQQARRTGDLLIVETAVPDGAATAGPIEGVLAVSPDLSLRINALPGTVPTGGEPLGPLAAGKGAVRLWSVLAALGGALLGGLILNIMPCVFPILSLKAISLARAGGNEAQARRDAVAYAAGILLTCLALGALMLAIRAGGTRIGWAFQLQDPRVIALLLILAVAITLNLAGLFELGTIGAGQGLAARGGASGSFWTGVLAAFVATPCTGPFMGAAMGAALVLPWPLALLIFAGLGLGLAAPFLAIAFVPTLRAMLPRPGGWMTTFRRIMAVPMGLTALALLWLLSRQLGTGGVALGLGLVAVAAAGLGLVGRAQRTGRPLNLAVSLAALLALGAAAVAAPPHLRGEKAAAGEGLAGQPFDEARLAALRAARRPVFLYFTADWCLTCKVNEANAIDAEDVRRAFDRAKVAVMVGDWTDADPTISRFLEAHGRSGVPLYLYYAPRAAQPQVLPQILTPATLTGLVQR